MRTAFRTWVAAAACTVSLVALAGQAEAADDAPENPDATAPTTAQLVVEGNRDALADPSPAGCVGKTHNPHRSGHVRGTINVVAETGCRVAVPRVGVHVKLYRSRWWGWEKRGDSGFTSRAGTSFVNANAGSPRCVGETHDWLGASYHESTEGGRKYTSTTANRQNNITC